MQDDEGTMNTQSERELARENTKVSEELKQQIKVNKTLSSKILVHEKSFLDERRHRLDLEKKLAMGPGPAAVGKENGVQSVNTVDDLIRVKN